MGKLKYSLKVLFIQPNKDRGEEMEETAVKPTLLIERILNILSSFSKTEDKLRKIQELLGRPINLSVQTIMFSTLLLTALNKNPNLLLKFLEMYTQSILEGKEDEFSDWFNNEACR